jgi:hypothetical protein
MASIKSDTQFIKLCSNSRRSVSVATAYCSRKRLKSTTNCASGGVGTVGITLSAVAGRFNGDGILIKSNTMGTPGAWRGQWALREFGEDNSKDRQWGKATV